MSAAKIVVAFVAGVVVTAGGIWVAHEAELFEHGDGKVARALQKAGEILPLEEVQRLALEQKPGRIIESEFEVKGGRLTYEIDILDENGQFWEVEINAKTGELVRVKEED